MTTNSPPNKNGWSQYQKLVLFQLETLTDRVEEVEKRLGKMDRHLTVLRWQAKATAAAFGAVAGLIPLTLHWIFRNG
jgi:hypothetical protein